MYAHGKSTVIKVNGAVVKAKTSGLNRKRDKHDTTGYGDTGHTAAGGLTDGTFTASGVYDDTVTTGNIAILEAAWAAAANDDGTLTVVVYPRGTTTGKPMLSFTAVMDGIDYSNPVDNMIQWSASWTVSGGVTVGTAP